MFRDSHKNYLHGKHQPEKIVQIKVCFWLPKMNFKRSSLIPQLKAVFLWYAFIPLIWLTVSLVASSLIHKREKLERDLRIFKRETSQTCIQGKCRYVANARVTAGFMCAPEIWPTEYIMTVTMRPPATDCPNWEIREGLAALIPAAPHVTNTSKNVAIISEITFEPKQNKKKSRRYPVSVFMSFAWIEIM